MSDKKSKAARKAAPFPPEARRPAKNRSMTFVLAIVFAIIAAYIIRSVYTFLTVPPIGTETVKMGSIDVPKIIDGIIVRDEKVYRSPSDGVVNFDVSENDRIRKGALVCSVDNAGELAKLNVEIGQIDDSIKKLQDQRAGFSLADDNSRRINAQIKSAIDGRMFALTNSNIRSIYSLRDSVTQNIDTRNQMILTEDTGSVRNLADQRKAYQDEIDRNTAPVYAKESGILSGVLDGLEETLTVGAMDSLTKDQTQMKVDYGDLVPVKNAKADAPIFKIVASNDWYIAAYIPSGLTDGFAAGRGMSVYAEKDGVFSPLDVEIQSLTPSVDGADNLVVFRCTRYMTDFLDMRSIRLKTSDSVVTGLKIPNTAIIEKTMLRIPKKYVTADSPRRVLKKSGDVLAETSVSIFASEEDCYLVPERENYLLAGDLVANPDDSSDVLTLTDTEKVSGVYRVNNGTAEFRSVVLSGGEMSNSGYTILDPGTADIRAYDSIVSDASTVTDGELIH